MKEPKSKGRIDGSFLILEDVDLLASRVHYDIVRIPLLSTPVHDLSEEKSLAEWRVVADLSESVWMGLPLYLKSVEWAWEQRGSSGGRLVKDALAVSTLGSFGLGTFLKHATRISQVVGPKGDSIEYRFGNDPYWFEAEDFSGFESDSNSRKFTGALFGMPTKRANQLIRWAVDDSPYLCTNGNVALRGTVLSLSDTGLCVGCDLELKTKTTSRMVEVEGYSRKK